MQKLLIAAAAAAALGISLPAFAETPVGGQPAMDAAATNTGVGRPIVEAQNVSGSAAAAASSNGYALGGSRIRIPKSLSNPNDFDMAGG